MHVNGIKPIFIALRISPATGGVELAEMGKQVRERSLVMLHSLARALERRGLRAASWADFFRSRLFSGFHACRAPSDVARNHHAEGSFILSPESL